MSETTETPTDRIRKQLKNYIKKDTFEETVNAYIISCPSRGYVSLLKSNVRKGIINLNDTMSVARKKMEEQRKSKVEEGIFEGVTDEIKRVILESKAKEEAYQKSMNPIDIVRKELEKKAKEKPREETVKEHLTLLEASCPSRGYVQLFKSYIRSGIINLDDTMSVANEKIKRAR